MELSNLEKCDEMFAVWSEAFEVAPNPELYETLIVEEAKELLEVFATQNPRDLSFATNYLKEMADLNFVSIGYMAMCRAVAPTHQPSPEAAILLGTVASIHLGFMQRAIPNLEYLENEAFRLVFESNMTKLGDNGWPIFREDGKIMKGPNYKEPDLTKLALDLSKQLNAQVDREEVAEQNWQYANTAA